MRTNASSFLNLYASFFSAKHQHRIHQNELMAPDLVSGIVLTGGALVIVLTILYVLWRTTELGWG